MTLPCRLLITATVVTLSCLFHSSGVLAAEPVVVPLWPGKAPGETVEPGDEKTLEPKAGEKPALTRITNVTKPTITITKPKAELDTGAAIVIAPGGGYNVLAWEHEGTQVAEWLNSIGVTAVLLKYRVPRRPDQPKDQPPIGALQDAQRAIGIVREKAKEWKIDPNRVGMLGFSAGGHLTAWASTNYDKRAYEHVDAADKQSCKPDFSVMIYPGGILDKDKKIKPEIKVTKDTPPSFLVVAYNDEGSFASTIELTKALKDNKVNAELHVYSSGGHGFGMKPNEKPYASWSKRCGEWLSAQGYLSSK